MEEMLNLLQGGYKMFTSKESMGIVFWIIISFCYQYKNNEYKEHENKNRDSIMLQ